MEIDLWNGKFSRIILIQWHSKKQSAVSLSTCEAEYRAMTGATKDPISFKRILEELNINIGGPIPMHSDNKSAIE
jgi:hypothetical protein